MSSLHPHELKTAVCVHCGRTFIPYRAAEVYCHLPACQRDLERRENADLRAENPGRPPKRKHTKKVME
jgi:uncharacterized OB-fold protein